MRDDWVSPWWQAATIPDLWDVCGFFLPPLSVWHVYALESLGNALLAQDTARATMDDVQAVVMFASRDWAGGKALLWQNAHRTRVIKRTGAQLAKIDPAFAIRACREYVTANIRHGHRMSQSGTVGTPAGTPEAWAIVTMLRIMGCTESKAWNTPYCRGRATLDAFDESHGNAIMTPGSYGEEMFDHWDEYKAMTGTRQVALN